MRPGIDPKDDHVFKWLFGKPEHARLLLDLVNAVLDMPVGERIETLEIKAPYNDKEAVDDKVTILDIRARDEKGSQYNIEMQMVGTPVLVHRLLYYWAQVHSGQLKEGDSFRKLRPTISICFVNTVLFPDAPDYHLHFELRSLEHPKLVFSNQQSMHLLELPKLRARAEELAGPVEAWCYFLIHGETLDTASLPDTLRKTLVPEAMEAMIMFTQDEIEQARYLSRRMAEHDRVTALEMAREDGLERGEIIGEIHSYQNLLSEARTPRQDLVRISIAELRKMADELEIRVRAKPK